MAGLGMVLMIGAAMAGGEADDAGLLSRLEPAFRHTLQITERRPIPVPISFCTPLVEADVGTRWNARSVTGDPITIEIVRGR